MKKLLFSLAALIATAATYAQGWGAPVHVVVKNYTAYNLYFAPRYNLAFWDGANDDYYFGYQNTSVGANAATRDLDYQQEGQFEMVAPYTAVEYNNGNTGIPGYPLEANPDAPTWDTSGVGMIGYQYDQYWFEKYMKLSWIRFALSTSTLNSAVYGNGLAYDFDPTGMTQVGPYSYVDSNYEIFRSYGASSISFVIGGTTIYAQFLTFPPGTSDPNTVHIIFYE